jgi:hypothetical protein
MGLPSGMLQYIVWWILTDISEEITASTIRVITLPDCTAQILEDSRPFTMYSFRTKLFNTNKRWNVPKRTGAYA